MVHEDGSKQQTIKIKNRALVLQAVLNHNIPSRVEIARSLGLTKTTLTNVVSQLIADGVLVETEAIVDTSNAPGRRCIGLALADTSPLICGVLIQRQNLRVVFADLRGKVLVSCAHTYAGLITPEAFTQELEKLYRSARGQTQREIAAVGISCLGPVNIPAGTMQYPHNFFNVELEFPIVSFFHSLTGVPTYLCHDAAAGAIAEKLFGQGRNESNFIYISTFNGIGAGFYLENRPYNGELGQSGELGHMSINFSGPKCTCGNCGCLELYANMQTIIDENSHYHSVYPAHPLFSRRPVGIVDVLQQIDSNDTFAMHVLSEYCRFLECAVFNLIMQLDINLVILADSTKEGNTYFESTLMQMLNSHLTAAHSRKSIVLKSAFGFDAPLYGSFGVVIDKIFRGEIYPIKEASPRQTE